MLSSWWVYLPSSENLFEHSFIHSVIHLFVFWNRVLCNPDWLGIHAVQAGVSFRTVLFLSLLSARMTGFYHKTHFLSIAFNLVSVKNHNDKGKFVLSVHYLKQSWVALDAQATHWERALWQVLDPSCLHLLSTYCPQRCVLSAALHGFSRLHLPWSVFSGWCLKLLTAVLPSVFSRGPLPSSSFLDPQIAESSLEVLEFSHLFVPPHSHLKSHVTINKSHSFNCCLYGQVSP